MKRWFEYPIGATGPFKSEISLDKLCRTGRGTGSSMSRLPGRWQTWLCLI